MPTVIRAIGIEDAPSLVQLSAQLGYPATAEQLRGRVRELGATGRDAVFVAIDEGESIQGWVHVSARVLLETDSFAEIVGLIVDENQRRSGIGRLLVRHVEDWARRRNLNRIRVRSNVVRAGARAFYERLGYSVSKQQSVFDKTLDSNRRQLA